MRSSRLYCVSNERHIKIFEPVPTRLPGSNLVREVVVAASDDLLFNFLLPTNCPRISFTTMESTTEEDKKRFLTASISKYVLCIESKWFPVIQRTILYQYEVPSKDFISLDGLNGYFISTNPIIPLSAKPVYNIVEEIIKKNIELRFVSNLERLAVLIKDSTLHYSVFGMREEVQMIQELKNSYKENR